MTSKRRSGKTAHKRADIQELADDIQSCVITLKQTGRLHEIDTQNTILDIIGRLPQYVHNRWKRQAVQIRRDEGKYPFIGHLIEFVNDIAEEVNDPVFGYGRDDRAKKGTVTPTSNVTRTFVSHDGSTPSQRKCQVCDQLHDVWACDQFKEIPVPRRWDIAKENHLCFRCLGRGHGGKTCHRSRRCSLDGCSSHHHLLHENRPATDTSGSRFTTEFSY